MRSLLICSAILMFVACTGAIPTEREGWTTYHDDRFGFSFQLPNFAYSAPNAETQHPFIVTQTSNGVSYGLSEKKSSMRLPIFIRETPTRDDVLSFVRSVDFVSDSCEIEYQDSDGDGVYTVKVPWEKDKSLDSCSCCVNVEYDIYYDAHVGKTAIIFGGQEEYFYKVQGNHLDTYDQEIVETLKFDR